MDVRIDRKWLDENMKAAIEEAQNSLGRDDILYFPSVKVFRTTTKALAFNRIEVIFETEMGTIIATVDIEPQTLSRIINEFVNYASKVKSAIEIVKDIQP